MNTTVDPKKMREIAKEMSSTVHTLNENIQKLIEATKEAQSLKDKAMAYDGQELDGERKEVKKQVQYSYPTQYYTEVTKYFAHVKGSEGGTAASGMRTITGATRDAAFLQITKILDFTDSDIDAVAECIESGIEEVETTLAKLGADGNETASNEATDTNDATDPNTATNPNTSENDSPDYTPSGGGGGGGGGSNPTPQYKKSSSNNNNNKTKKDYKADPTPYKSNDSTNTNNSTNTTNSTNTNTSTGSNIVFDNNNATQPTNNSNNTNNTNTNNTTNDPTGTNPDNPTPSAVVPTKSPNYTSGKNNGSSQTPIEVLGEDTVPKPSDENNNFEESIINSINRVVPELKPGDKIQSGSALIPGAAGISAAAAAGLGSKAVLDRSDNLLLNDNYDMKDDDEDEDDDNNETPSHKTKKEKKQKDDKSWLYGMGVGLGAVGAIAAKKEHDKDKEEDYEIADDTPKEPEILEDD